MTKKCEHHFILDPPNGTISIGRCKKCNETKEHYNYKIKNFNKNQLDLKKGLFANGFKE